MVYFTPDCMNDQEIDIFRIIHHSSVKITLTLVKLIYSFFSLVIFRFSVTIFYLLYLLILPIIIWLCLTRTGNYKIHEFDWLKSILTAV